MKKIILLAAIAIGAIQTSCLAPMGAAQPNQAQQGQRQPQATAQNGRQPQQNTQQQAGQQNQAQDPLQTLLGGLANNAISQAEQNGANGSFIGNLLASITGNVTTTQANLVGTWTYSEPCVQFESENKLTQAGGTTAATSLENKLVSIYKMVGITPGTMTFTFSNNGQVAYTIGQKQMTGTYTFDSATKTVTITGSKSQHAIKAYVTISGNNMSLCFDSSKVLALFSTFGSQYANTSSTLGNIAALSQNFNGMKTGFKFRK